MSNEEFIKKMRELDPFMLEEGGEELSLDILYDRFVIVVNEMERLEDIEDDRVQMKLCIEGLEEKINELTKSN